MRKSIVFSILFTLLLSFNLSAQIFVDNTLPYYTDPTKISQIKVGDSYEVLSKKLGIQPYDIFHMNDEGSTLISYKYRLKLRKVTTQTREDLTNLESQTTGSTYYNEEKTAYVLIVDGKVSSLLTSSGIKDSRAILVLNNVIRYIGQDELINEEVLNEYITKGQLIYYMNNHFETVESKEELVIVEEESKPSKDEFNLETNETESLEKKSKFYSSIERDRMDFHPMLISSKKDIRNNLPGKNFSGGKVLIGVLFIPSFFFMGKEIARSNLRGAETMRRNILYKLQNKKMNALKEQRLNNQLAVYENKIIRLYGKMLRKGWTPEKH